ncbi:MAG: hypothetical protein HY286_18100 [Planctomycetes bacterium]|nr:hypothetical protein [Planctomycetota bacterium]
MPIICVSIVGSLALRVRVDAGKWPVYDYAKRLDALEHLSDRRRNARVELAEPHPGGMITNEEIKQ